MDFTVIGTIKSFVKTKNLTFAAKHKIRTGQTLTNSNGNLISTSSTTFDKLRDAVKAGADKAKQAKLNRIKQKLLSGKKISDEEMGFLRVNAPKLYKKAKAAEEAREDLKEELRKAKSKEEAREAMTRAMVKASTTAITELSALGNGGGSALAGGSDMAMQSGGDMMNISGGEVTATAEGNANISCAENQTPSQVNQSVQSPNQFDATNFNNHSEKNSSQKNSSDELDTPEEIMEKYLMTIRALEDEWARFTNSKEYQDLPEHTVDEVIIVSDKKTRRQINAPNRKILAAAQLYRKAMMYSLAR